MTLTLARFACCLGLLLLIGTNADAQYLGRVHKNDAGTRIERPAPDRPLAGTVKTDMSSKQFQIETEDNSCNTFAVSEPQGGGSTISLPSSASKSLLTTEADSQPAKSVQIDYAAIEQEYAKAGAAAPDLSGGAKANFVLPNIQQIHTPNVDPHYQGAYITDDNGTVHYRPDLKATVCECGTPIPSASCLQNRAGVGLYAQGHAANSTSAPITTTVAAPAMMRAR